MELSIANALAGIVKPFVPGISSPDYSAHQNTKRFLISSTIPERLQLVLQTIQHIFQHTTQFVLRDWKMTELEKGLKNDLSLCIGISLIKDIRKLSSGRLRKEDQRLHGMRLLTGLGGWAMLGTILI